MIKPTYKSPQRKKDKDALTAQNDQEKNLKRIKGAVIVLKIFAKKIQLRKRLQHFPAKMTISGETELLLV